MTLEQKLEGTIKDAMRAKDAARLRGLREIKAQILLAKTDGSGAEIDEAREIKILQKMQKQRRDSLEIYQQQNRDDLAQKELEELAVIEEFLPQPMDAAELEAFIRNIVAETGAAGMKDMGKVMAAANQGAAGRAEGKAISEMVKRLLG